MYVIAGLGNPGKEYDKTRHNAGFEVIDYLADKAGIDVRNLKHKALVGKGVIDGNQVLLVKPQTYMNLSGESLREIVDYYKIDPESELIVISDDIALDVGNLRVRGKGSAGGHNGLKNIILHLHTENFIRVRVGVGDKGNGDLVGHVLGKITGEDRKIYDEAITRAAEAVKEIMNADVASAMNKYNVKMTQR